MKIAEWLQTDKSRIRAFTLIWTLGSVIASAYFAFWLFPEIYAERTSAVVEVEFQSGRQLTSSEEMVLTYYPNQPTFRDKYLSELSDQQFFYFSACEALPLSQRPICDSARNWRKIDPKYLGCSDVKNCTATSYRLSEEQRFITISGMQPVRGATLSIHDLEAVSLSDPGGWGEKATWPVFFVSLFLGVKLGREIGEFWFTPYQK